MLFAQARCMGCTRDSMGLSFASCRAVLCVAGLCLSAYALYIEIEKHRDASYRPLCDISEGVSCTKAFLSE